MGTPTCNMTGVTAHCGRQFILGSPTASVVVGRAGAGDGIYGCRCGG
jgi:hypothetical protein